MHWHKIDSLFWYFWQYCHSLTWSKWVQLRNWCLIIQGNMIYLVISGLPSCRAVFMIVHSNSSRANIKIANRLPCYRLSQSIIQIHLQHWQHSDHPCCSAIILHLQQMMSLNSHAITCTGPQLWQKDHPSRQIFQ